MTYGHLRTDCLYTGISSGPNDRYRVWESLYLYLFIIKNVLAIKYKNSSGDEIANVNFCTTTTYM